MTPEERRDEQREFEAILSFTRDVSQESWVELERAMTRLSGRLMKLKPTYEKRTSYQRVTENALRRCVRGITHVIRDEYYVPVIETVERVPRLVEFWRERVDELSEALDAWPDDAREASFRLKHAQNDQRHVPVMRLAKRVRATKLVDIAYMLEFAPELEFVWAPKSKDEKGFRWSSNPKKSCAQPGALIERVVRLELGPEGLDWGSRSKKGSWRALRELDVRSSPLDATVLRRMEDAGVFEGLEVLRLRGCGLTEESVSVLAKILGDTRLDHLEISGDRLRGRDLEPLYSCTSLAPRTLVLSGNALDADALKWSLRAWSSGRLRVLELSGNPFGDRGLAYLRRHLAGGGVEQLAMREVGASESSLLELRENPLLMGLRALDVSANALSPETVLALANAEDWDDLVALTIGSPRWSRSQWIGLRDAIARPELSAFVFAQSPW